MPGQAGFEASVVDAGHGEHVVHVHGGIEYQGVRELAMMLQREVRAPGTTHVVVDLAEVPFLDAQGVSVLVRSYYLATLLRRAFSVRNPNGPVRKVLQISGVGTLLRV